MFKKTISAILTISILSSLFLITAFADDSLYPPQEAASRFGEKYVYSKVSYYNSAGDLITGIEAGDITAKIKIKSETETAPLFFAAIYYQDGKLMKAGIDTTPLNITPEGVEYEATVNVSAAQGAKLVSVLWENSKAMVPVCSSAISTSSDARLASLSVDNGTLNFDANTTEYEVVLDDPTAEKAPYISCSAVDNGATVEISDPVKFPGEAKVKVTAADGVSTMEYTIKYVVSDDMPLAKLGNFVVPAGQTSLESNIRYEHNLTVDSFIIPNRNTVPLAHVDESLIGLDYITTANPGDGTLTSYDVQMLRGGKLMLFFRAALDTGEIERNLPAAEGWSRDSSGWDRGVENTWADEDGSYGDRVTFDDDGNVIATDGIVNDIPAELSWEGPWELWEPYYNSIYDVRKQGWVYIDYRGTSLQNQGYRQHSWGALAHKMTKEVSQGETVTVPWLQVDAWGTFAILEWADWTPNDYTVF